MSKHHHDDCCNGEYSVAGYGAYGMGASGGYNFNRWIYALLILIVIVLQFGRNFNNRIDNKLVDTCDDGVTGNAGVCGNNQLIDNSVLFIIIVFLLIISSGCWGSAGFGGGSGY